MGKARRGQLLVQALVMVGLILAVGVGMVSYFEAANRRTQAGRWDAAADNAARSGLALMLGWARASVDKTRETPQEWDNASVGTVLDALPAFTTSDFYKTNLPAGVTAPTIVAGIGQIGAPPRPGDIITPTPFLSPDPVKNDLGEYVIGVEGNYVISFKLRLQTFDISDQSARMYKIGVAGRVRLLGSTPTSYTLVADRVQLASIGRQPLSRFAALIDTDMVGNWVPGEVVQGPVHINRGYVDADPGIMPLNTSPNLGRSIMRLQAPGSFNVPSAGPAYPEFTDSVSMTYKPGTGGGAYDDDSQANHLANFFKFCPVGPDLTIDDAGYTDPLSRGVFEAPDNQATHNGFAAPNFVPNPVLLPTNSRGLLDTAVGAVAGESVYTMNWFKTVHDGVYLPTNTMNDGTQTLTYANSAADRVAGGIYVRGTVEQMRLAVEGTTSYYGFQLGSATIDGYHRVYVVAADRLNRTMVVYASAMGHTLREDLAAHGNLFSALLAAGSTNDPAVLHYGIDPLPAGGPISFQLAGLTPFPFNGVVFVDYAYNDPIRTTPGNPVLKPIGGGVAPTSGHILALGDPGAAGVADNRALKTALTPGAFGGPSLKAGEYINTEDPHGGAPFGASRLTIISSGNIFIQNHLLVQSIMNLVHPADDSAAALTPLQRNAISLHQTNDLLGLVADRQIVVGLCAPDAASRPDPGVVITATMAALGDPAFNAATGTTDPIPTDGLTAPDYYYFALRGSFSVESVTTLLSGGVPEPYNIDVPNYPTAATTPAPYTGAQLTDTNPLYDATTAGTGGGTSNWGFANMQDPLQNPNLGHARGRLVVFGSLVLKKRGAIGVGNGSYDKDYRYDQRLLSLSPPLFPNSVNLITLLSKVGSQGLPPYLTGPSALELAILN